MAVAHGVRFSRNRAKGYLSEATAPSSATKIASKFAGSVIHHRSIAASLGDLFGARLEETLAGYLIMLLVLILFFAFRVLSEALGEGRLERMLFVDRESR
jgi:hypothetical protein